MVGLAEPRLPRGARGYTAVFLADSASWAVALIFAELLRYDFVPSSIAVMPLVIMCLSAATIQRLVGLLFYLYRDRYLPGSFDEAQVVMITVAVTGFIVGLPVAAFGNYWNIPRSTVFIALPIAAIVMVGTRFLWRIVREKEQRPHAGERALIFGAGPVGVRVVRDLLADSQSAFLPVGFIDDDPQKSNMEVDGVPVRGTWKNLARVVGQTGATVLLVTIVRADSALLRDIRHHATGLGLRVKVVPSFAEMLNTSTGRIELRDISVEDLIGRVPIKNETGELVEALRGKRVLVTGAGGSIGSELCKQISLLGPAELLMLDRDESGLQMTQLAITGHGLLTGTGLILADIRDALTLHKIFREKQPEVVFHAAALKHLTMLERFPEEAWQTNVLGTLNVLEAATAVGVEVFVNISTDKAANPTSVLGHSKLMTERLTAWFAAENSARYLSVRFGNVLGSRGSLIPLLTSQIQAGGPVTITHPEMTRFFMTIPEACHLVLRGAQIGSPGEVLVLDMGEPVKILDVATQMIELSGQDIDIVFTGIRPGEKLDEELFATKETLTKPFHPKISHTMATPLCPADLVFDGFEAPERLGRIA